LVYRIKNKKSPTRSARGFFACQIFHGAVAAFGGRKTALVVGAGRLTEEVLGVNDGIG
jgi:hypothetical protein